MDLIDGSGFWEGGGRKVGGRRGGGHPGIILQVLPYEWGEEYKRKKREEELILLLTMLEDD